MFAGVPFLQLILVERVPLVTFGVKVALLEIPLIWHPSLLCLFSVVLPKSALPRAM